MNIHEYQAKELFRSFGIPVSDGRLAQTVDEAVAAANELSGPLWVVKAQVHAGGRGKAGGVKVCKSIDEVREAASAILGMTLVTKQTGPAGKKVHKVLVERGRSSSPLSDALSKDLKKRGMSFVGTTVMYAYLQAVGVINSHEEDCFLSGPAVRFTDRKAGL